MKKRELQRSLKALALSGPKRKPGPLALDPHKIAAADPADLTRLVTALVSNQEPVALDLLDRSHVDRSWVACMAYQHRAVYDGKTYIVSEECFTRVLSRLSGARLMRARGLVLRTLVPTEGDGTCYRCGSAPETRDTSCPACTDIRGNARLRVLTPEEVDALSEIYTTPQP